VWDSFASLRDAAMSDGEVPARLKEAVALAISVSERCDGCISYHARAAARAGAAPAEVAELLGVVLLMDGATASLYGPRAWHAYRTFAAELAADGGECVNVRSEGPRQRGTASGG
jgi:AhpD family alkylhydroperoxidase